MILQRTRVWQAPPAAADTEIELGLGRLDGLRAHPRRARACERPPVRTRAIWLGSGSVSPGNGIPDQPIRAYLSRVTSIKRAVALKPADVEQLRALGYMGH